MTSAGADTVSVADRALNSVVATVPVGDSPRGIALTPNGKLLYVANWSSPRSVSMIATLTNLMVGTVGGTVASPSDVAVGPLSPTRSRR